MTPFMGAPQHPLLGAADNYAFPMTNGLLGSMSQPTDWTQVALNLAGNPHAGPYANAQGLSAGSGSPLPTGNTGSSAGSAVTGLLGALAKNPSLVKGGIQAIRGLLGSAPEWGSTLSPFGAQAAAATASELSSAAAPALAADTAAALAPVVGAAPTAAELGTTADALAPFVTSTAPAAAAPAAAPAAQAATGAGLGAGGAAALGIAALPLALAAFVPYNSGFSNGEVQGMLGDIAAATKANGGLLNAGSGISNGVVSNPQLFSAFQDLNTLLGDSSDEFTKAGGQDWVYQQLANLGYGNLVNGMPGAITTPSPSGHGWFGGGYTGKSRA